MSLGYHIQWDHIRETLKKSVVPFQSLNYFKESTCLEYMYKFKTN